MAIENTVSSDFRSVLFDLLSTDRLPSNQCVPEIVHVCWLRSGLHILSKQLKDIKILLTI